MDIQIAEPFFKAIEAGLNSTLMSGTAKVMLGVGASFGSVWMVHFALKSLQWLFTGIDAIYQDILWSIFKMAIIVSFAFNVSWYIENVVPFVTDLPTWMGGILSGQQGSQTNQVDSLISAFVDAVVKLVDSMDFDLLDNFNIVMMGVCVLVFMLLGGIPFLSLCVGTLITLKVATTLMLVIGPLFIAFALFDQTRQWFYGWVSLVGGFMLTNVLFSVVIGLEIGFINTVVMKNGTLEATWVDAFSILLYFGAFTLLAAELPSYAASIMGGTPSGATGVAGLLGKGTGLGAAGRMAGAASKAIASRIVTRRNTIK